MNWLALDIGGANIKAADGHGYARSYSFALWREPPQLVSRLRQAIAEAPPSKRLVVTMTGELADCFESKAAGVRFIVDAVCTAGETQNTLVYLVDGRLVPLQIACHSPLLAAASNWHALARFAGRYATHGGALAVDVGSTTCDVIPLLDGRPVAQGKTDTQRLLSRELVYTGIERSPICAVVSEVPYRSRSCPVAQELFATMRDAHLLVGNLPEDPADTNTADGRPATRPFAQARLARMIAADLEDFNHQDAVALSQCAVEAQVAQLSAAIEQMVARLPAALTTVILAGHGEFLANRALQIADINCQTISLNRELGPVASRCAPAHALAVLAREIVAA